MDQHTNTRVRAAREGLDAALPAWSGQTGLGDQ